MISLGPDKKNRARIVSVVTYDTSLKIAHLIPLVKVEDRCLPPWVRKLADIHAQVRSTTPTPCRSRCPRQPVASTIVLVLLYTEWSLSSVRKPGLLTCGGLLWLVATVSRSESRSRCDLIAATRPTGMEPPPTYYSHPPGLPLLILAQISSSSGFMLDHESYCSNKNEKRQTHTIHFKQLSPSSVTQGTYKCLQMNYKYVLGYYESKSV